MAARILVTGAAGFIGSHTAQRLLAQGKQVVGIDNFNHYYSPERKRQNVKEVQASAPDPSMFLMLEGDIRNKAWLEAVFKEHTFDAVVHLAAMAGVRASMEDPQLYLDVNLSGTLNLLDQAKAQGDRNGGRFPNFVLASTSSAYGRTEIVPFIETDSADKPLAPYPASKRAAELMGHAYHHLYQMDFTALRFFTVYGPRGRPDMMAYKVLDNIFFEQEVPLYNGGQMHRDWTYVDDIAAGVIAASERRLGYEVINLGRGEPILLADFVRSIEKLAGKSAKLKDAPMMSADISYTYANIEKAQRLLGYAPKVSVEQGVEQFWRWYQDNVLKHKQSHLGCEPNVQRHFVSSSPRSLLNIGEQAAQRENDDQRSARKPGEIV